MFTGNDGRLDGVRLVGNELFESSFRWQVRRRCLRTWHPPEAVNDGNITRGGFLVIHSRWYHRPDVAQRRRLATVLNAVVYPRQPFLPKRAASTHMLSDQHQRTNTRSGASAGKSAGSGTVLTHQLSPDMVSVTFAAPRRTAFPSRHAKQCQCLGDDKPSRYTPSPRLPSAFSQPETVAASGAF